MQRLGMVEQAIPHPGCSAYLDAVGVHLAEGVLQIVEQDSCGCIVWGLHPLMMPWKAHSNSTSVRHSPARSMASQKGSADLIRSSAVSGSTPRAAQTAATTSRRESGGSSSKESLSMAGTV